MNITANGSSSWNCYSLINQVVQKHVPTVASGLILVVSLIGNSLIVTIVFKTPTLKKPINFMIVNMAISDLLFPIFLFPLNLVEMQADPWLIGDSLHQTLCKISLFLLTVSATVSIQSLILITVDRFGAVVMPIRGSPIIGRKLCLFFIVVTWIVAVAANSPHLFAFKFVEYPGEMVLTCVIEKSSANYYIVANFIAFFYIPFVLLIILYAIILIKLKQNKPIRVNKHPTLRKCGQDKTETCLTWPSLSCLCFFFAGSPTSLTRQYFILHRTVPFGLLAIFSYTISLPPSWPPQTAPSTRLPASFSAVIIAKVLKDLLLFVLNFREVLLIWVNRVNSYNLFLIC